MPRPLRGICWLLVVLIILGVIAAANQVFEFVPLPPWAAKTLSLAWLVLNSALLGILVHIAGDAARYLHVAPPNIEIRRRIRDAGVQLLKKLHSCSQYDRILVVGHSLGSVIGYDILTHLWPSYHDDHVTVPRDYQDYSALHKLEELTRQALTGNLDVDGYQAAQSEYLAELQSQGNKWLVTDFVTLGSPLAHASVLVARNEQEFTRKKEEREFPVCPPVLEEGTADKSKEKGLASVRIRFGHHTTPRYSHLLAGPIFTSLAATHCRAI